MRKIIKVFFWVSLFYIPSCFAGNQQYEVLKNETRALMSQMVADNPPDISSFANKDDELVWLAGMDRKLQKYNNNMSDRIFFLKTVHYEALRAGLDPDLVLGLIQVESGFKKYAISGVGARGYTQVMPFWINLIGNQQQNLFSLRTNLRYGCTILRHYLDMENGNLPRALARYNGSLGSTAYANSVIGAWKQWKGYDLLASN